MKNKEKKGFTLAELLIVVAIIAVLVAIAIPIFNKQIEKAREAYDIYTMRVAASAAVELYYSGVKDKSSAEAAGLSWWPNKDDHTADNAAGAYDISSGTFYADRKLLPIRAYGKGTTIDGGTQFYLGNKNGAYAADWDYRKAAVMVAIYPNASPARVDVFWKNNVGSESGYVGDQLTKNVPKYSISIPLN